MKGLRSWLRLPLLLAALGASGATLADEPSQPRAAESRSSADPERIVLILVDTLRRDHVSLYGAPTPMPTLEALAARGQVFQNAVASFCQTSMSMGALFTGRTPSLESGMRANAIPWNGKTWCGLARFASNDADACVPAGLPTLAELLRRHGYWTLGVVTNFLLYDPAGFSRGFDDWVELKKEPPGAPDARAVNAAVAQALARRRGDRFFLYVHYMDVHDYLVRGQPYAETVGAFDAALAELIALLERARLLEGALVILTSDHGEMLGEAGVRGHFGNPSREPVLRIPLVVAPPSGLDGGALVRSEDLFRIVASLAGVAATAASELEPDELFVSEPDYQGYRKGRWKSLLHRPSGALSLFDLSGEQGESPVAAGGQPEVEALHALRLSELTRALAARHVKPRGLSPEDRERLRKLGYLP